MTELVTASRRRRIFAFMIDHAILSLLAGMGGFMALGKHWDLVPMGRMMTGFGTTMILVMTVYALKDSFSGMSPGRFVLGIAVRNQDDPTACPSVMRLALRNLSNFIWPVEFFVLAFSKDKRRLGDRATRTVVIRRTDIAMSKRLFLLASIIATFCAVFAFGSAWIVKNSSAYEQALIHIEADPTVSEMVGSPVSYGYFPAGSVQTQNGYGWAELAIDVIGSRGEISVVVTMQKKPESDWQLEELFIME